MKAAPTAVPDTVSQTRRAVSALTRAPSIPRRRSAEAPVLKRAAVVLRRGMRPLEFRRVEDLLEEYGVASLPVVPGQRKGSSDTPVCGLIITGSDIDVSAMERDMIEAAVQDVAARGRPILAFTDGAPLVLEALGLEPLHGDHQAILITGDDVRELTTARQVEDAFKAMAKGAMA